MGKLCTDQLIGRLVTLLREANPDRFDEAVEKAKKQLDAEQAQDLEKLFDSQIATLEDRGCPAAIIEALQNQKDSVVRKASEMTIGEGNIPFLPVLGPAYLGYYGLMSLVRNGQKEGYTYLNPTEISDVVDAPNKLYYIYDVEDGGSTRGESPEAVEKILKEQSRFPLTAAEVIALATHTNVPSRHHKKQSRFPLTAAEVIALATHTNVPSRHYVWAPGSRYGSANWVPIVSLDLNGRPRLGWDSVDNSHDLWGSASCSNR